MPPAKNQPVSANYWGKYNHPLCLDDFISILLKKVKF